MKKILLIIIDGLGDKPVPGLGGKTPLEAAATPNLDELAEKGACGLIDSFQFPGEEFPTSEGTHVAMFGYKDYFLGRGPYEAAGAGVKMRGGDIALRINFATVDKDFEILDRRAGRIKETKVFVKALSGIKIEGVKFILKKAYGHRGILLLRGKGLSPEVTDGDPHEVGGKPHKIEPREDTKEAKFTAKILNEFLEKAHKILQDHPLNQERRQRGLLPANYLLTRGAGEFRKTPSFRKMYRLRGCCIAGGTSYKGVARILGMKVIKVEGATGMADTDLAAKFSAAKKCLKKYDFVFLHIKAVDTYGHDGDCKGKREFIEKIDKNLKIILDIENALFVVTGDHSTPCAEREHSSFPLPILISGKKELRDSVNKFGESYCKKGRLGMIAQSKLMEKILRIARG